MSLLELHAVVIWLLASALAVAGVGVRRYIEHSLWLTRAVVCLLLGVESAIVGYVAHVLTGVALDVAVVRALCFIGFAMVVSIIMAQKKF